MGNPIPFYLLYMFLGKNKIDKKMIPSMMPTSKAALKQQALIASEGDIEKATRLYEFMIKDMEDIPLLDPIPPSKFEQAKTILGDGFNWMKENQDTIVNWVSFFRDLFGKGGPTPPTSGTVPPINR